MGISERAITRMEQLGPDTVREIIASGGWPANYRALAEEWLRNKDKEYRDAERNAPKLLIEQSLWTPAKQVGVAGRSHRAAARLIRMEQLGPETIAEIVSSGGRPANHRALAQVWLRNKDAEPRDREHNEAQALPEQRPPSSRKQPGVAESNLSAGPLAKSGPSKIRLGFALWFASILALVFVVMAAVWGFATRHAGSPIQVETSTALTKDARVTTGH